MYFLASAPSFLALLLLWELETLTYPPKLDFLPFDFSTFLSVAPWLSTPIRPPSWLSAESESSSLSSFSSNDFSESESKLTSSFSISEPDCDSDSDSTSLISGAWLWLLEIWLLDISDWSGMSRESPESSDSLTLEISS